MATGVQHIGRTACRPSGCQGRTVPQLPYPRLPPYPSRAPSNPLLLLPPIPPAQAALAEQGISTPTEIQAAAIPALLRHRSSDYILASHTGSGKTLAYLLPIGALRLLRGCGPGERCC